MHADTVGAAQASFRCARVPVVLTDVHGLLVPQLVHEGAHARHVTLVHDARVQLPLIQNLDVIQIASADVPELWDKIEHRDWLSGCRAIDVGTSD